LKLRGSCSTARPARSPYGAPLSRSDGKLRAARRGSDGNSAWMATRSCHHRSWRCSAVRLYCTLHRRSSPCCSVGEGCAAARPVPSDALPSAAGWLLAPSSTPSRSLPMASTCGSAPPTYGWHCRIPPLNPSSMRRPPQTSRSWVCSSSQLARAALYGSSGRNQIKHGTSRWGARRCCSDEQRGRGGVVQTR